MRHCPRVYPGTGLPGITPRHGKNLPHGECEIGGSCEKSHDPTTRSSQLWPPIWPGCAVPEGRPCGGDMGGVASALRYEAAGSQQPDRRSCGPYGRDLSIRGGGGECEGAFPRKPRLETRFMTSTQRGAPAVIARRVPLDVQSRPVLLGVCSSQKAFLNAVFSGMPPRIPCLRLVSSNPASHAHMSAGRVVENPRPCT